MAHVNEESHILPATHIVNFVLVKLIRVFFFFFVYLLLCCCVASTIMVNTDEHIYPQVE